MLAEDVTVISKIVACSYPPKDGGMRSFNASVDPIGKHLPVEGVEEHNLQLLMKMKG